MGDLPTRIDHLVYAVPDLQAGTAAIEGRFGVASTAGGSHVGLGTRNALLALGSGCYLEIIGPDPDQVEPERPRPFGIDRLDEPRLVTWAVRESRLAERREQALLHGIDLGGPRSMSRERPDGALLEWRLMRPPPAQAVGSEPRSEDPLRSGIVPFFIDWGRTPSPAATAASGCRLSSLRAEAREAVEARRVLALLGIEIPVVRGPTNLLIAEIETPKGLVELS